MSETAPGLRRFSVHAEHMDRHHARLVAETSFEAAAAAYVEDLVPTDGDPPDLRILVRDLDTGRQHCFVIDLGSGEAAACGQANETGPGPLTAQAAKRPPEAAPWPIAPPGRVT